MKRMTYYIGSVLSLLLLTRCASLTVPISEEFISISDLTNWQEKNFYGRTIYSLLLSHDKPVIKAVSSSSASMLYQEVRINLDKTPYINWSWCIENTLGELNEQSKAGDDYSARVYIVIAPGLFGTIPRSINYVWSNTSPTESFWNNAYAEQVKMLAVRSGSTKAGLWLQEKRNVKADLKLVFGEDVNSIIAIAIMTDTDNSNTSIVSYYGDIFFSTD